jgi:hypothetical protein
MLKVAGWIISNSAVDDWRRAHPELEKLHAVFSTTLRAEKLVKERMRKGFEPLPISGEEFICISWPKVGTHSFSVLTSDTKQFFSR